jgi:ABC-2 type transport system permease protein
VNWRHFQTLVWLRWRLFVNQQRRGGAANVVALVIVAVLAAGACVTTAITMFVVGLYGLANTTPAIVMYVWDGLVAAFLLCWAIGLTIELQRSEALSLTKFLHLPVSLRSAFAVNYLSSLICPCMVFFFPAMVGLSLGLVLSRGPLLILVVPLAATFVFAVTALTYQFQGWLAALMSNPRRRRTVIVVATATLILLVQIPNLFNLTRPHGETAPDELSRRSGEGQAELRRQLDAKAITSDEYQRLHEEGFRAYEAQKAERSRESADRTERTALLVNTVLPPGWLPWGAMALAQGRVFPALLGALGLGLIGGASMWRAYRTTLRLYTGQLTSGRRKAAPKAPAIESGKTPAMPVGNLLVERRLPVVSEQVAAIALAGFRGLVRAPEAKMMLLSPVIMLFVFGSILTRSAAPAAASRPWIATGAIVVSLLMMGQLIGNQFGFDRSGFRVFVLCSARRGDILLGKNLSIAPLAMGLIAVALAALQVVYPMRFDLFLAAVPEAISMYVLYCLAANILSIYSPMAVAAGSFRPANSRIGPILIHLAFTFLLPIVLAPALMPLGVEYLLDLAEWRAGVPVALLLSLVVCAGVITLYRFALTWQGSLLQHREQRILQTVASKAE